MLLHLLLIDGAARTPDRLSPPSADRNVQLTQGASVMAALALIGEVAFFSFPGI